jgi:hypothetical protein
VINAIIAIAAVLLHLVDWAQTRSIAKEPHKYGPEMNPILGPLPDLKQVNAYFLASGLLLWALIVALLLGPYPGAGFVVAFVWAAVEAWAVVHNWRLGIRV